MNRRQDAFKAMNGLKNLKMQGRAITISWAAGKGVKSKEWKDYWDLDLGVSYIPWDKIDKDVDLDALEEGGMFDEDSIPQWMKEKQKEAMLMKEKNNLEHLPKVIVGLPGVDISQPPPSGPMLPGVPMVPPFPMGHVPRFLPPPMMGIVPGMPLGVPPPQVMLGMQPDIRGPPPPIDKTGSALNINNMSNVPNASFMGIGMQAPQFPPLPLSMPPPVPPPSIATVVTHNANDDHMDIDLDDDDDDKTDNNMMVFNKPPPVPSSTNNKLGMGNTQSNHGNKNNFFPFNNSEQDRNFDQRKDNNDDFRNNTNYNEKNERFENFGRRWNENDRQHDITGDRFDRNPTFGSGIQNRLRDLAESNTMKHDNNPPSLLDMAPIKNDNFNLNKNVFNVNNSMPVNFMGQRNFMDNRRDMDESRNPIINHGGNNNRQRFRNDDRDMFNNNNNNRRDGMYIFFSILII